MKEKFNLRKLKDNNDPNDIGMLCRWMYRQSNYYQREKSRRVLKYLDGRITSHYKEMSKHLSDLGISHSSDSYRKPYFQDTFKNLSILEWKVDAYEELLKRKLQNNHHILFPNIITNLNYDLADSTQLKEDILAGKEYTRNLSATRIALIIRESVGYVPIYSEKATDLTKKLMTTSFEDLQILQQHIPEAFTSAKISDYGGLMNSFNTWLEEHGDDDVDHMFGHYLIAKEKLIPKYFDELKLKEQREERFEVGKQMLYALYNETIQAACNAGFAYMDL